jgi:tetratricopeptide (TPR) repeat protein
MPAKGFDFSPWGLSYRATRKGDEYALAPVQSPVTLLTELGTVHDPWLDKLKANCWYMEAEALRSLGDAPAAIDAYLRAASLAPRSQSMHYNISLILLRLNELEKSIMIAKEAIDIDPVRRGPYELAASILTRLGQHQEAEKVHKRALKWARIP